MEQKNGEKRPPLNESKNEELPAKKFCEKTTNSYDVVKNVFLEQNAKMHAYIDEWYDNQKIMKNFLQLNVERLHHTISITRNTPEEFKEKIEWMNEDIKKLDVQSEQLQSKIKPKNDSIRNMLSNLAEHFGFDVPSTEKDLPPFKISDDYSNKEYSKLRINLFLLSETYKAVFSIQPPPLPIEITVTPIFPPSSGLIEEIMSLRRENEELKTECSSFEPQREKIRLILRRHEMNKRDAEVLLASCETARLEFCSTAEKWRAAKCKLGKFELQLEKVEELYKKLSKSHRIGNETAGKSADCIICFDPFDARKIPYVGACGHSICIDCLRAMGFKDEETKKSIKCTKCREISIFRKNFSSIEALSADNDN